ncbi:MAG: flavodoxin family protein [Methanomassiliicoccales archaeon]|nr:flavodoxin family protein [Methanomassiliicoccales archaeon]
MNILAINGSPRKDGRTSALLKFLMETGVGMGCSCEFIHLIDLDIEDCRACMVCKESGECAVDDDMKSLYDRIREADILMLGSPIYMGAESGRMKCFLDRLYAFLVRKEGNGAPFNTTMPPGKGMLAVFTCNNDQGCIVYDETASRYSRFFSDLLRFQKTMAFVVPVADNKDIAESCYARNLTSAIASLILGEDMVSEQQVEERTIEGRGVEVWGKDLMYSNEDEEDLLFSEDEIHPALEGHHEVQDGREKKHPLRCPRSLARERYPMEDEEDDLFSEDDP